MEHIEKRKINIFLCVKDEKRPYQTGGLDSFVIEVYDDKLTLDTPVRSILDPNYRIKLSDFLSIIKNNMSK